MSVRLILAALHESLLALYGPGLVQIVLYGSHARGNATPDSDIDVLVVLKGPVHPLAALRRMSPVATELSLEHDVLISLLPVDEAAFGAAATPLLRTIRAEGVAV